MTLTLVGPAAIARPQSAMAAAGVWNDGGACAAGVPQPPAPQPPAAGPGGDRVVGYFTEWGIHGRNFQVKDVSTSGAASRLTHVLYAFGNVTNGKCAVGDSYADYDKAFTAAQSVDGVADSWDSTDVRGNFGQLRKLKKANPGLKVLWSFGGWTWSGGFGQAAANPEAFAKSCHDLVEDPRRADVSGAFNPQGPNAPHSPLTSSPGTPTPGFDVATAITTLKRAGVPADKMLLGIGFHGRGWTGVAQAAPGGTATGPAPGPVEAGIADYRILKDTCPATSTVGGTAYALCGSNWWSYDTPATIAGKQTWREQQGLGGTFVRELGGDTADGELMKAAVGR